MCQQESSWRNGIELSRVSCGEEAAKYCAAPGKRKASYRTKRQRGSAYIYVLLVFVVVTMFSLMVTRLFTWNLSDTVHQRERIQMHYLTRTAGEMALAALTQEGSVGETELKNYTIAKLPIGSTRSQGPQTVNFKTGTAEIWGKATYSWKSVDEPEVKGGAVKLRWVKISIHTEMKDKRAGQSDRWLKSDNVIRVLADNPALIVYE